MRRWSGVENKILSTSEQKHSFIPLNLDHITLEQNKWTWDNSNQIHGDNSSKTFTKRKFLAGKKNSHISM